MREALLKDGWQIRHDLLVLQMGTDLVYVDMSADAPLSAERNGQKIAVEVKSFLRPSDGKPRTLIVVACPGEKLQQPIAKKGHRGTRYYNGVAWPDNL